MDKIILIGSALFSLVVITWFIRNVAKAFRYRYQSPNGKMFRGGAWIGFFSATWPFGILEVNKDSIVLKIEGMDNALVLTKENLEKIKIKKFLFGIYFYPRPYRIAYFWYWPFKLKRVTNSLKEYGWL